MKMLHASLLAIAGAALLLLAGGGAGRRAVAQDADPAPVPPPAGTVAVVLFSGNPDEVAMHWNRRGSDRPAGWQVRNGALVAGGGDIASREQFADCQVHVEFRVPLMPDRRGQGRGNSGVYLLGRHEIQVLDSYDVAVPGKGDCGALYGQAAALLNACRPPLRWQTYDILYRTPRTDPATGKVLERGRVTVLQNGIAVQNNQEVGGTTVAGLPDAGAAQPGPLLLQDHGCAVEYRNIWVVRLPAQGAEHY